MNTTQNSTKSKIVKVIGVDLAKDHCDVIGYDENGKICLRLDGCSYAKLREILSNLPQAVVLMEACKGSMFHARSIADLGHEVRLVKPEFADLFYAYGVLDSGRFIGESSHLVGLGSNQASFYLRA